MAKKSKKGTKVTGVKGKVIKLLKAGKGPTEVARLAGCSLTTARYHAKRIGMVKSTKVATKAKTTSKEISVDHSADAVLKVLYAKRDKLLEQAGVIRDAILCLENK